MPSQIISATTQYPLGGTNPSAGSLLTFKTVGLTASCSVIPKLRKPGAGTSNLVSVPYLNVSTNATATAGTAITADGVYQITATGPESLLDATVSSGTATIDWWIVEGLGGSGGSSGGGGGGGGAVTVADGADVALGSTTDAAVGDATGTVNAHLRQVAKTLATGAIVQVLGNDNAAHYLPAGDNLLRPIFVAPGNGTNLQPSMDNVARPGFQALSDGTTKVGVDAGTAALNVNIAKDSTAAPTTPLPVSLWDQALANQQAIKAASTAAAATDVAAVVAVSPNNVVKVGDGTTSLVMKAASTAAVAGDVSAVVAISPNTPAKTVGNIAQGSAAAGAPVLVGGSDGTNVQYVPLALLNANPTITTQNGLVTFSQLAATDTGSVAKPLLTVHGANSDAITATGNLAVGTWIYDSVAAAWSRQRGIVGVTTIGGTTLNVAPTLTVTASAYAAGNNFGGLLTLTNAVRYSSGTGIWNKVHITDHGNQKPLLDILLFNTATLAATFTDKSAFPTLGTADNAKCIARISILSTDWVTVGGSAFCTKVVGPIAVTASGSANLAVAMNVTSGTPTPASTSDYSIIFGFLCD